MTFSTEWETARPNHAAVIAQYQSAMIKAAAAWHEAKRQYSQVKEDEITEGLRRGLTLVDAEGRASKHPKIAEAIADCTYYRNEATAYAQIIQALRAG